MHAILRRDGTRTATAALVAAVLVAGCGGIRPVAEPSATSTTPNPRCISTTQLRVAQAALTGPVGPAPVIYRIATTKPIVFLTIDDGWTRDPRFPALLEAADVPTSLFITNAAARLDYDYFRRLQDLRAVIEDHTLDHPDCTKLSYAEQKREICATADRFAKVFGVRPELFRPPYGSFNLSTRLAAAACGMRAVIYWDVTVNSGQLAYAVGDRLRPGDIILMHFTPKVRLDFKAALAAAADAGLTIRRLERHL